MVHSKRLGLLENLGPIPLSQLTDGQFCPSTVGYIDTSTDYRVFIPYHRNTIISRDVNLKEDFSYINSHNHIPMIEDEEREALKVEHGSPTTSSLW